MRARKWKNSTRDTAYTYSSWIHLKDRCLNLDAHNFGYYGGRGISVCERWFNDYDAFFEDMGPRPEGTTIERINNNENYEPGNCRWATRKSQVRNRCSNRLITMEGITKTITEWAEDLNTSMENFSHHIKRLGIPESIRRLRNAKDNKMTAKYSMEDMCQAGCTSRRGIRHWQEQGLFGEVERTPGRTRKFTQEQLDKARIVAAASFGGWSLEEISEMLIEWGPDVHEAILSRLADQAMAAARLATDLPKPPATSTAQEFDL